MMNIDIVKIKEVVTALIEFIRQDLIDNALTPNESWLYREFNGIVLDDTNFYTQLKHLIEKGDDDRQKLEVRLMFDKDRANLPTIHIHYPSETVQGGDNTLNTGYMGIEVINDHNVNLYARSFVGQYELIVTGGNSLEVVMLYEFLDGLLIAGADTLSYNFDKFEFSGKQLMPNQDIIPYLIYYRAIGVTLQNKKIVTSLLSKRKAHDIQFEGTLYADDMKPETPVVSVTITSNTTTSETGDVISFLATPVNGGDTPSYEWYIDNVLITGETTDALSLTFANVGTFALKCKLYSSLQYLQSPATSNTITIVIS